MKNNILRKLFVISCMIHAGYCNSFSQGIDNIWLMGYDSWVGPPWGNNTFNFAGGSLVIDSISRKMCFRSTDASICDKNGNLLFYTNGIWIANSKHDTMQNGAGLNPGYLTTQFAQDGLPLSQGDIIIPIPSDSTKFYLIHETVDVPGLFAPTQLLYSVIDMKLDSPYGGLISKNNILINDTISAGELTATKHANGRDWWILVHKHLSDSIHKLLISPNGILHLSSQKIGNIRLSSAQSAFSPDGTKYACYNTLDDFDVFDFDRCSGLLSNYIHVNINDSMIGGGVSFSPNGRFVYVSSIFYLYQFDLMSANIPGSKQTIAIWDSTYSPQAPFAAAFYYMQLAADNKIYINTPTSTLEMHVINYPDSTGLSCDVQQHSIHLGRFNAESIPNHPNYFLGPLSGSPCDSLTGLNEIPNCEINLLVSPNPASDVFNVNYKLPYGVTAHLRIYDTLGKEVMHKMLYWYFGYLQIDAKDLKEGMYFIKVEGKGVGGSVKVVIMK